MKVATAVITAALAGGASAFVPTTPSTWVQSRTSTTLFLFGGAEEQPVGETPQLSAKQKAQQAEYEEEMKMAADFREKMFKRLSSTECHGESGGVSVVYTADSTPTSVVVSPEALAGGAESVAEEAIKAMKAAQAESQKTAQSVMASMNKDLMAELQAQEAAKNKK